jgi:hypothetical protein
MTGLFQSPGFRFSVGSIQYKNCVFLKTEHSKLKTTGLFSKVLLIGNDRADLVVSQFFATAQAWEFYQERDPANSAPDLLYQ